MCCLLFVACLVMLGPSCVKFDVCSPVFLVMSGLLLFVCMFWGLLCLVFACWVMRVMRSLLLCCVMFVRCCLLFVPCLVLFVARCMTLVCVRRVCFVCCCVLCTVFFCVAVVVRCGLLVVCNALFVVRFCSLCSFL